MNNVSKIFICLIGFVNVSCGLDLNDIQEVTTCYAFQRSSQAFSRNTSWKRSAEAFPSGRSGGRSGGYSSSSYTTVRGHWRSTPSGGKTYVRSHRRRIR